MQPPRISVHCLIAVLSLGVAALFVPRQSFAQG